MDNNNNFCQQNKYEEKDYLYSLKKSIITKTELEYGKAIRRNLPDGYYLFPQINLSTFIKKMGNSYQYRNELFRNVDFLVTDNDFTPIIAIEINDKTHLEERRKERDIKVKNICEEAGIHLLRFWTSYGINEEYISKKLLECLNNSAIRIKHSGTINKENAYNKYQTSSNKAKKNKKTKQGCYIATAVYGSYDCPEVWTLRRFRDYYLSNNLLGKIFIKSYYAISPTLVRLFGNYKWFCGFWRNRLNKFVSYLNKIGYKDTPYKD